MTPSSCEAVLVALGSNVGDRREHLSRAIGSIAAMTGVRVAGISRLYENPPWGGPANQGDFLNAVILVEVVGWDPDEFLAALLDIEHAHGRVRSVKNGPRTLDLDVLLFGDRRTSGDGILLPHPAMLERPFVLRPAADVAPFTRHPTAGLTIAEAAANVGAEGLIVIGEKGWHDALYRGLDRRNTASR